jgi:hypothetical protein
MSYMGDFHKGATVRRIITTVNTSGVPTTLAGTPVISAYEDGGTTEITAGITLTVDFDSRTGMHLIAVDTSDSNYERGKDYHLVITTGTVGGSSVVGYVVGSFSIEARLGIVDMLMKRGAANVEALAEAYSMTDLILASPIGEWDTLGGSLNVKRTDGTTAHRTKTLATAAPGDIVTGVS